MNFTFAKLDDPNQEGENKNFFDEDTLVANSMVFLIAGHDATARAISFTIFELARNPQVQKKLRKELDSIVREEDSYQAVMALTYLDMVFHEIIRLYPSLPAIQRSALEDYKIPGMNIVIKKGKCVYFNIAGMHNDKDLFPNPEAFNPENFSEENKSKRHDYAFSGFGHGPRNCVGMRFAMLMCKLAIAGLVSKFDFLPCQKTSVGRLELDPKAGLGKPLHGLYVKAKLRK